MDAVIQIQESAASLVVAFAELQLPLALKKGLLIASDPATLRMATGAMGKYAGTSAPVIRRLAYDHALNLKTRSKPVRLVRMGNLKKRVRYMKVLSTKKTTYSKVMYAGGLPAGMFGAECSLMPEKLTRQLRGYLSLIHI